MKSRIIFQNFSPKKIPRASNRPYRSPIFKRNFWHSFHFILRKKFWNELTIENFWCISELHFVSDLQTSNYAIWYFLNELWPYYMAHLYLRYIQDSRPQDRRSQDPKTTRPQVKTQDLYSRLNIVSLYMRGEFDQGTVGGVWSVPLGSYRAGIWIPSFS